MLVWARPEVVQQYHLGKFHLSYESRASHSTKVFSSCTWLTNQVGANILLAYFHYCNRGTYPFSNGCKDSDLRELAKLDEETIEFVKWTRDQAELYSEFANFPSTMPLQPLLPSPGFVQQWKHGTDDNE